MKTLSKTQQAVNLVMEGMRPYAAARQVGLPSNAIYTAVKRMRDKQIKASGICPCCRQKIEA
jgi:hypothetical protein